MKYLIILLLVSACATQEQRDLAVRKKHLRCLEMFVDKKIREEVVRVMCNDVYVQPHRDSDE